MSTLAASLTAESGPSRLARAVDLARYPIHDRNGPAFNTLLETVWRDLSATGACVLEGFLQPVAVSEILAQVDPLQPDAFVCSQPHNVYLIPDDPAFPAQHARNRRVRSVKALLADDEIPAGSPLRDVYEDEDFRAFLRAALHIDALYPFADNLASVNVNFYGENQELGWHFDNSIFTVTLMLRQAQAGGLFEFAPNIRQEGPADFDSVGRILDGDHGKVQELKQDPGALVLFKGSRSLHRVTPSFGAEPRTIAILSYASEPGYSLKEHTRRIFYGRVD
ncbi:MAG TPA: 2OG-Fe(II) oxygenase [Dongiaceae bacterium]